jgi:hypothetical protein
MRRLSLLLCSLLVVLCAAPAHASKSMEATIQDDPFLVYAGLQQQRDALDKVKALGVDRVRVTVLWRFLAPSPTSPNRPARFDATDPGQYPITRWEHYDNLLREAAQRGIAVNMNVTGPSPTWANKKAPRSDVQDTYEPSPKEFGQFVRAVATRYSGRYTIRVGSGPYAVPVVLPRASFWSIWNEPNQSGWLTPQWKKVKGAGYVERASSLYRSLLDAAWDSLQATGHGKDTILIGETAPGGIDAKGVKKRLKPLVFLRALYCVDKRHKPLRGRRAKALGCPSKGFAKANPALFKASGYGHHPYELLLPPSTATRDRDNVNLAALSRLTSTLDKVFRRYKSRRKIPLQLTEYGYQTAPDPIAKQFVSFDKQAEWINQAEYLAWRNPRVKSLAQFLLYDDAAQPLSLTFQSGLYSASGQPKPSLAAYAMPLWVVKRRGNTITLWGRARVAAPKARVSVLVQHRPNAKAAWKTVKTVTATGRRAFQTTARGGKGELRLVYGTLASRTAAVR